MDDIFKSERIMSSSLHEGSGVILKVEKISKSFLVGGNKVPVIKDIQAEINQGEFVMLMGPSGCGKSTLLHVIYGLHDPDEGDVFIEGESIWKYSKNWRANFRNKYIGYIPQQTFWIKSLSVIENVAVPGFIGGKGYRESLERAGKMLELIGMKEWAHYRPLDLSGGQQQRVALARALLLSPKFIIADEPTGNLDQKAGKELLDLLWNFNREFGITILMVTHNPEQENYATRIIRMVDGQVISNETKKSNAG